MTEKFPFNSQYDNLIKGETISKRGQWWTALLLVESKTPDETPGKRKIIIQRWKKQKKDEGEPYWRATKNFTITSKNVWAGIKETLDEWISQKEWE